MPEEGEVEWEVNRLRSNRSGGPLGMREEHIKGWLAAARREDKEGNEAGGEKRTTEMGGPEEQEA